MRTAFNFVLGGVIFTTLLVGGIALGAVSTYGFYKEDIEAGKKWCNSFSNRPKWYTDADFYKETDKE